MAASIYPLNPLYACITMGGTVDSSGRCVLSVESLEELKRVAESVMHTIIALSREPCSFFVLFLKSQLAAEAEAAGPPCSFFVLFRRWRTMER